MQAHKFTLSKPLSTLLLTTDLLRLPLYGTGKHQMRRTLASLVNFLNLSIELENSGVMESGASNPRSPAH